MGKVFTFFSTVSELVVAIHDFSETMKELVVQLKALREDLREEQQHRESIYRLLMNSKVQGL